MPPPKKLSLFFLFILIPVLLFSQQIRQYVHTRFKTTDGLASAIVNNAVQDHNGFIWLSTINGLQRYDGNKFITFRNEKNNPHSLPSDDVTFVYEDSKNNLWVLTADNKAGIFNTSTFRYKEVPIRNTTAQNVHVYKQFIETPDGHLLLLFRSERLYSYHPESNEFRPEKKLLPFPKGWTVSHIAEDKIAQKYILTSDSGIAVFNTKNKHLNYRNHNPDNDPLITYYGKEENNKFTFVDNRKRLFLFQRPKDVDYHTLKLIDLKDYSFQQYDLKSNYNLGPLDIKGILDQSNGRTWIYGLPFLAEFINKPGNPFQFIKKDSENELGIKFTNIYSLYEDREKNVWVSSDNGLYVYNPDARLFENYRPIRPNEIGIEGRVQTALQFGNGNIWLGSLNYGLFCYDENFNPLPAPAAIDAYQKKQSIWQIFQHSRTGYVLLALEGGKIIVYDPATKNTTHVSPAVLKGQSVTQITEDHAGNLWLGTREGQLIRWNFNKSINAEDKNFSVIAQTERIQKLLADKQGFIWVATFGEGLLKVDPRRNKIIYKITKHNGPGKNLWSNTPSDIFQYNDSVLLVVSDALNLLHVKSNDIEHISTHNGLPSNTALSVTRDKEGSLWLGMVSGLCRAHLDKGSFTVYDRNDGILDDNFNISGAFQLQGGRLMFTSEQSFLVFNPAKLKYPAETSNVSITDFKIYSQSLSVDSLAALDKINIAYKENSISVEFNVLRYNKLNKISYYYQLEGLDKDWIRSDARQRAVYNYLPPGSYTFRVKTRNAEGVFSDQEASLSIRVYPPFWKAWWFYSIIALLLVIILYLTDRERRKRRAALQDMRSEIGKKLHEDISTTLSSINLLSQIARLKADRNIEKSKEFIEQIGDKSNSMAIAMDDMLWSIDPKNDGMEKTLLRILEFVDALRNRHQAFIDVRLDDKLKTLELDMKVRYEFLLICKEALRCLVQYSECKRLMVNIDLVKSKILLKILSQGCELDPNSEAIVETQKTIGKRVKQINAAFDFEFNKDQTSIVLSVPFKWQNSNGQHPG